ncbi:MAG: radical SAM protein [Spirochaetaceae bacterium]|nr:radical SAM protein [Spirochaetaceae bacterium]
MNTSLTSPNTNKQFFNFPICVYPFLYLGLGWNNFSFCPNCYSMDFGNIKETPRDVNIKNIFNHENFVDARKKYLNGEIPDYCNKCLFFGTPTFPLLQTHFTNSLIQIEDFNQKQSASENYISAISSIFRNEIIVDHLPVISIVACGSSCNLKCKYCYQRNLDYHPDPYDILKILDQIHSTLLNCHLSGGEPFVCKAGREILKRFSDGIYKFNVRIVTNAQFVDFDLLKHVNLQSVHISADAASRHVYESIRQGGNFDNLINNIKKFIELKKEKPYLKLNANFTITSDNYHEIPDALKLYEDLVDYVTFNLVMAEENDPQNIKERSDLYEPLLKNIDIAIANTNNNITKDKLNAAKSTIINKIQEKQQEQQKIKEKKRKLFSFWKK